VASDVPVGFQRSARDCRRASAPSRPRRDDVNKDSGARIYVSSDRLRTLKLVSDPEILTDHVSLVLCLEPSLNEYRKEQFRKQRENLGSETNALIREELIRADL